MSQCNDTIRALSEITDTGLFEQLAAAVLRGAKPELYGNLTQPGVNAAGKPVRSPVDGVSFVPASSPPHMITAHHTTQGDLRKKWLYDPSTVTTRDGRRPATPAGDLIKTAALVSEERKRRPELRVTLALTTNQEPAVDVTLDAEQRAGSEGIVLDIWSRSRIAHYLDNNPDGQWLRRRYLGIAQERLSPALMHDLSKRSLSAHKPIVRDIELVSRDDAKLLIDNLSRPVGFLVGESGYGKSVVCHQRLSQHTERGGYGLVLPANVLASSITLDQAIDSALRQLHPALAEGSGAQARSMCSADLPLLIVVEDVSRTGQNAPLIERLANWAVNAWNEDDTRTAAWRLICPIWPELFSALSDATRRHVEPMSAQLGPFAPKDARGAVVKRAEIEGIQISALDADLLCERLGYDPLLIGLCDLGSNGIAEGVIARFVTRSAERLAAGNGTRAATEYASALRHLAGLMLERRQINPAWRDVLAWFDGLPDQATSLRELVKHGEVIRVADSSQDARLVFRHDRVYKWLLTNAAIHVLSDASLKANFLSEAFFADVIGTALAHPSLRPELAEQVRLANPLALFHALSSFREPFAPIHHAILAEIDRWLSDADSHSRKHQSLRYAALHAMSDTQSTQVVPLLARFRDRSWTGRLAGLRNGDLKAAIGLCYSLEPGSGAEWRDRAIEHAKSRFGPTLLRELDELLKRPGLTEQETVGGLRITGHLCDTTLADAIAQCWSHDAQRVEHLADYLWAAAQCGGERTEELLSPVCDAWAALPSREAGDNQPSPRDDLAATHVAWAFWRSLPEPALKYFIQRAAHDDLRWQITYMLHGVDHPEAVAFLAKELADRTRAVEGTDSFFPFASTVGDHWRRWQRERNKSMSKEARARLFDLWNAETNDKHLRTQAFRIWAATTHPDDLVLLQSLNHGDVLGDQVLGARLKRGDKSAIPALIAKLSDGKNGFWWQFGREIWSDDLTAALDQELARRGNLIARTWDVHCNSDWIASELVTRLPHSVAEQLLVAHWEHLRFSPDFVQSALYIATPPLLTMAKEAINACPDPAAMLKYVDHHFGIKTLGHPGVTRIEQLQGLIPYLDHLDPAVVHRLWQLCNELGWMKLRREHLDGRLGPWRKNAGLDDDSLHAELNVELTRERVPSMDFWIERHLSNGRTLESILGIVREWLRANKTTKALEIAAAIVAHVGSRADVDLLHEGSDQSDLAAAIIADASFEVRRRTLS